MDFQKICKKINQCLGEGVSSIVTKEGVESVCISIPSIIDVVLNEGMVKLIDARIEDSDDDIMTILENKYPSLKFFDRTMVLAETQINKTVNNDIKGYVSNGNDISSQKEINNINVGKTNVTKSINTTNNKSNKDKLKLNIRAVNRNFFSGDSVLAKDCHGEVLINKNNYGLTRGKISNAMYNKLMMCSSDNDIECFVIELTNARSTNKANIKNGIPQKENITNLNKLKKNVKMINQWFFKKSYLVATKKGVKFQLDFKNLLSYKMITQISEITDMRSAIPVVNKMIKQWPSLELCLKDNVRIIVTNNIEEYREIIDSINKKAFTQDVLSIVDSMKLVATGSILAGSNIDIEDIFFVKLATSKDDFTLMATLNCLSEQYQGISDYLKPNWKMDEYNEYYIDNKEEIDAVYQELKLSVSRVFGLNAMCEKLRKYFSVKIVYDAFEERLCCEKADGSRETLLEHVEKYFIDLLETDYMDFDNLNMFLWKCYRSKKSILRERPLFYTNNKLYTGRGIIQSTLFEEKISELNKILKKDLILTEEGISYDGELISIDELDVVSGIILDWNYPDTNGYFEIVNNEDFAKALKITNKDYKFIGSDKLVQRYTKVMEDADIKVSGYIRELMDIPDEYFDFVISSNDLNIQFSKKDIKDIIKLKKRIEKSNGRLLKINASRYGYTVELSNPLYESTVVENSSGEIIVFEVPDLSYDDSAVATRIETIRYMRYLYKNNVKEILEHIDKCVERYRNQFIEKAKMVKVNDDICIDDIICKLPDVSQLKDSCNIIVLFDCIKVDGKDVLCTKTGVNLSLREITNLVKRVVSNNMQQTFDTILEEIQNSIKRYDNILHLCKDNPAYAAAICLIYDEKDKGITTYKEILKGSKTFKMRINYSTNKFYGICSNYTLSKIEEMLDYMLECNMLDTKYVKTRKYDYYALVLHHDINDAVRKKIMDVVLDSNCKVRSDVKDMIQNSKSTIKPKSTKKIEVNNIVEYFKQLEDRKKDAVQDVLDSLIVNIETVDVKDGECIDKFIDDNSKYVKDNWSMLSKQIPKFDDKLLMYLNLKMNLATSPVKKKAFEVVIDIEKNK